MVHSSTGTTSRGSGRSTADRFGTRFVIWFSILGTLPFTLALPYVNLPVTAVLTVIIGLIIASAFSAIVVFAQELLPGRVGLVAGLFFLSFWIRVRDGLFAIFAAAFWLMAVNQALPILIGMPREEQSVAYLLRLAAFLLIIAGVLKKNLSARK